MNPKNDYPQTLYSLSSSEGYLAGRLLLASPNMTDERFRQSVVLLCQHNANGAMGIVLNKPLPNMQVAELIKQFDLETDSVTGAEPIYFGGPVESIRGFVLHTDEYVSPETQSILPHVNLTATIDVVRHIAGNTGPRKRLMALGYASWEGGQLERELEENAWVVAEGSEAVLFDVPVEARWHFGYESVGLEPSRLSQTSGSA